MPQDARIIVLDARTAGVGADVEARVLEALAALGDWGVLEVHGAARPDRLRALLTGRGLAHAEQGEVLRAARPPLPPLEDLSCLEPPLPAQRVLEQAAALPPGEVWLAHLPRYPRMLAPKLRERPVEWAVGLRPDGTAVLWLRTLG